MKLLVASDIHGDLDSAKWIIKAFKNESCDKILLLGDILYHGPRNDLPNSYSPKAVISILNEYKEKIIAVRGNCDTEVDQMVLEFPILSDYTCIFDSGLTIYATHGHKYTKDAPLPMCNHDIMLGGHTHIPEIKEFNKNNLYINPGSIALPKENNPRTYMVYENRNFTIKTIDGSVFTEIKL